jgi:hypothetical protein
MDIDEEEPRIRDLLFRVTHSADPFDITIHTYWMTRLRKKQIEIQKLIAELEEDIEQLNYKKDNYFMNLEKQDGASSEH